MPTLVKSGGGGVFCVYKERGLEITANYLLHACVYTHVHIYIIHTGQSFPHFSF
uniref:Uncharacterized protein n=1 Tax=Octopus bimaculoides TaxID=37653 RepID=A0A0L8I5V0_OCTBM